MEKRDYQKLGDLVIKAQKGDRDAFDLLYEKTHKRQYRVACAFLNDPYLAEDALQEIYLSVFEHLDAIKKPNAFIAYLNAVTYTVCIREKRKLTELNTMLSLELLRDCPDTNTNSFPEQHFVQDETVAEIIDALSHLPEKHSQAFLLRHLEKLQLKEIAGLLDCSLSSVKRYLKTAEFELHNRLEDKGFRIVLWGPFLASAFKGTTDVQTKGHFLNTIVSLFKKASISTVCKTAAVVFAVTCVGGGTYSLAATKPAMADNPPAVTAPLPAPIDTDPPVVTGYSAEGSNIIIHAQDNASGIDYSAITAASASGQSITPLSSNTENGSITFEAPKESLILRLTDMAGNVSESSIDVSLE